MLRNLHHRQPRAADSLFGGSATPGLKFDSGRIRSEREAYVCDLMHDGERLERSSTAATPLTTRDEKFDPKVLPSSYLTRVLLMGDAEAGGRQPPTVAPSRTSSEGVLVTCCASDLTANVQRRAGSARGSIGFPRRFWSALLPRNDFASPQEVG